MKNLSQFLHAAARSSPLQYETWINPDHIRSIVVMSAQPLGIRIWLTGKCKAVVVVGGEAHELLAKLRGKESVKL